MELEQVFSWLVSGGGSIAAVSWILERSKWFQVLDSDAKEWLFFALVSAVSIVAYLIQAYVPMSILEEIQPIANILISVFSGLFLGKSFHLVDKE